MRYLVVLTLALALPPRGTSAQQSNAPRDGQHNFDFEIGSWKGERSEEGLVILVTR